MSDEMARVMQILWAVPRNDEAPAEERRLDMDSLAGSAPMVEGTDVEVVDADGVPGQWLRPPGVVDDGALLYLHGGGYCVGSVVSHTPMASKLGAAAGLPVLIVDYRLGPEHRFPAAVDDAVTAFRWLVAQGLEPERIAVAGDSAGGGLTLATLLALRAAGDALPGAAACISPWTDLTMSAPSMDANVDGDPMLDRPRLQTYADWYLGPDRDATDPLVSPPVRRPVRPTARRPPRRRRRGPARRRPSGGRGHRGGRRHGRVPDLAGGLPRLARHGRPGPRGRRGRRRHRAFLRTRPA